MSFILANVQCKPGLVGIFCLCTLMALPASVLRADEQLMLFPVESVSDSQLENDKTLERYSHVGRGHYTPLPLRKLNEKRVNKFETSFEECAPGRNSVSNERSIFGAVGDGTSNNAMGVNMRVHYPVYDLVFRLYEGEKEISPSDLESFRLGLMNNRIPAIWGGWRHNGMLYKVTAMTAQNHNLGNFDLFKMEIQNPTDQPLPNLLVAALDGSPDMRLEDRVIRGLGSAHCFLSKIRLPTFSLC